MWLTFYFYWQGCKKVHYSLRGRAHRNGAGSTAEAPALHYPNQHCAACSTHAAATHAAASEDLRAGWAGHRAEGKSKKLRPPRYF